MSIFDSINICDPKPKVISLQEESPEIHSDSKTKHSLPKKSRKNRKFSISKKQNLPKEEERVAESYELQGEDSANVFYNGEGEVVFNGEYQGNENLREESKNE